MLRHVSAFDHDKALRTLGWPVREVLIAYVEHLKVAALASHRHAHLEWTGLTSRFVEKPPKQPEIPKILK